MTNRRAMTKVAQGLAIAALMGGAAGVGHAQSQPGYPPAPVQSGAPPSTQPAAPPAPAPPAAYPAPPPQIPSPATPAPSQNYPPQYPPPPPPDYPPQAGPPYAAPPGYPQQPYAAPGYPQQPYPAQGYPQQPYAGPPGYPQQPYPPPSAYPQQPYGQPDYAPPGYPPPGYFPPGYAPPPPPPTRPHGHGALLLLPYAGLHAHEGTTGQDRDAGFRIGSLLGYRMNGQFSLNAELTIDFLNIVNQPAGTSAEGAEIDLALSPLFHFDAGALEVVIGPKLGIWGGAVDTKDDFGTVQDSASGLVVGGNLGAFLPLGNGASLGGLVSFVVRTVSNTCTKPDGGGQKCMDTPHADSEKVLGITAAALF